MAEPQDSSVTTSESTLQLNIKTLDSRIYNLNVDKNIPIAAFKEKIANQSGVPVEQQRIIFRGKVLKDDHLLADYNVENGDTLHLVERQPQAASASNTGEATSNNSVGVNDSNAGGPRNRIGPIAHSIVLGTLNVGDSGEAAVPDISRVIGAVLNSIGFNNQTGGMQPGVVPSHVNQPEGYQISSGGQRQDGNHSVPLQASNGQSASHTIPFPPGPAISPPSLNTPIPDSLHTLMEFITRMEPALSADGHQPNQSTDGSNSPTAELPSNSLGLPTVEALSIVLQNAQRLLSDHAAPALSRIAARLNQDTGSNDPAVRMQLQIESVQLGMAMQHLGALFLELGRTMLTLRIGQSSAESFVNAGPAVYISPSGPNPIMAQPFPLQTSSIFAPSSGVSPTPLPVGAVGGPGIPRNVNIHIHTGAALAPMLSTMGTRAPTSEGMRGENANATESGDSGQARGLSGINITTSSVPSQRGMVSISGAGPPVTGVSLAPNSNEEINAQIRRIMGNVQNESNAQTGQAAALTNQVQHAGSGVTDEDTTRQNSMGAGTNKSVSVGAIIDRQVQNVSHPPDTKMTADVNSSSEPSTSSEGVSHKSSSPNLGNDDETSSVAAPLGLGLGGLQPKKKKQPRTQGTSGKGASASSPTQQSRAIGQHVLQSLASFNTGSTNPALSGQSPQGAGWNVSTGRPNTGGQSDMADAMSQILDSPALDGLLSGVSQQTGIGSPDMLRNMLQQFTQNPEMRNTVNQIAQQVDNHDLGSMFSGMDRGAGGAIDLGRMMQQMMPIVSQALGGMSPDSQRAPPSEQILTHGMAEINNRTQRTDVHQVIQMLENQSLPEDIFNSLVDRALDLSGDEISRETIANTLRGQGHLAQELMEMLHRDISERFKDKTGS